MIVYKIDVLKELKNKGYSQYRLVKDGYITARSIQAIRDREAISFKTLGTICSLLGCQPGDIIAFIPEK